MPLTRETLERQLATVQTDLDTCVASLKEKKIVGKDLKKNPTWRHLDAKARQLKTRLGAVKAVEDREAECAVRAAGGGAAPESEDE